MDKTSIIIHSDSSLDELINCVESIRFCTQEIDFEIIVVDNGASVETEQWLQEQLDITSILEKEGTQARSWNLGIEEATGSHLLFMHSDTIVTPHWLTTMLNCLLDSEETAVTGPVSNRAGANQTILTSYTNVNEMIEFATGIDFQSNTVGIMEESLGLSDFCFLFKKSVIEQVGKFDESIDDRLILADYSLRLVQANYKMSICRDAFVHHYGNSKSDERKAATLSFYKKWGFPPSYLNTQANALSVLSSNSHNGPHSILELGCGCGASLLSIKQRFPQTLIYGVEESKEALQFAHQVLKDEEDVYLYSDLTELVAVHFDTIILKNGFSTVYDLINALKKAILLLTPTGKLIMDFANVHHHDIVRKILSGNMEREIVNLWGFSDISSAFEEAGFQEMDVDYLIHPASDIDLVGQDRLKSLIDQELPGEWQVSNFIISAKRESGNDDLFQAFDSYLKDLDQLHLTDITQRYDMEQILSRAAHFKGEATLLLNSLALFNFERNQLDEVLPYLTKAYELNPTDANTLLNLGRIMYLLGEEHSALKWFMEIPNKSSEIIQLIRDIENKSEEEREFFKKLKYLILKIEYNVDLERNSEDLFAFVLENKLKCDDIVRVIDSEVIDKSNTLTRIARHCYSYGLYDWIIPLYNKSLTEEPDNRETLISFGLNLIKLNAIEDAYKTLLRIKDPDTGLLDMILKLGETLSSQYGENGGVPNVR